MFARRWSRPWRKCSRGRQYPDPSGTSLEQRDAACLNRGSSGHHVVDQYDRTVVEPGRACAVQANHERPAPGEGLRDVRAPVPTTQRGLGRPVPHTPEGPPDRESQKVGQVVCLIEAAVECTPRVQGHRHDGIGTREKIRASVKHQTRQRPRQCPTLVVFEGMHNGLQGTRVQARTPRHFERGRLGQAPLTQPEGRGVGRQRVATQVAQRIGQPGNPQPAPFADRTIKGSVQRVAAPGTGRRQQQADESVCSSSHHHG